jgi:hypothetical protein
MPYEQIPLEAPTRTRNFSWFTSDVFLWRTTPSYQDFYVHFLRGGLQAKGMVQANVGHKVMLITLSKGYFCTNFYIRWSRDVTSQSTTTQTTNKHHHHGDGATRPSSGMDLIIPHRPRGRQPCACSFQSRCRRILFDLLN